MASKCPIEVLLSVRRKDCRLENTLAGVSCRIERLAVRPDRVLHKVIPNNGEDIEAVLRSRNFDTKRTRNGTVWVECTSCSVCSFFARIPFLEVVGMTSAQEDRLMVKAQLPSLSSLRYLKSKLKYAGLEYHVADVRPFSHMEVTQREREALQFALERNYFEFENRSTLSELAEQMGVSKSSLSETLRRGTRKAVIQYLSSHE